MYLLFIYGGVHCVKKSRLLKSGSGIVGSPHIEKDPDRGRIALNMLFGPIYIIG